MIRRLFHIEGLDDPDNRLTIRYAWGLMIGALVIRTVFALYTHRTLEDALITVIHAENCVAGIGLTHHASEPRVHGFTSPLSVLIPLIGECLHPKFGISFIKIVSALCSMLAVFFVMAIAIHPRIKLPPYLAILPMTYVALEHHQIYFGMAGMETQMVTTILLMSMYCIIADKPIPLGISLGLCMLARPDFGFWTVIVGGYYLCTNPRRLLIIVPAAFAVYGPWLLFTILYYGSPLPNPLLAKSLGYRQWWEQTGLTFSAIKRTIVDRTIYRTFAMLGPCYDLHAFHPWARYVSTGMALLAAFGGILALIKRQTRLLPMALFALFYWAYYVFLVPFVFGWYLAPFMAILPILAMKGVSDISHLALALHPKTTTIFHQTLVAAYLICLLSILPTTFNTDRLIQRYVENGVRKPIGEYLAREMKPEDTISCEPLGYVGYYSRRTVYDWPGLGSKKVTTFLKTHPTEHTMNAMITHFVPTYLLLRPWELEALQKKKKEWLKQHYTIIQTFQPASEAPTWIQQHFDARYTLLKRIGNM